jgi:hypothetical protein
LDRYPDYNGNYEPHNCRWATQREQSRNTRRTLRREFDGKLVAVIDLAEGAPVTTQAVHKRLRGGASWDAAVKMPRHDGNRVVVKLAYDPVFIAEVKRLAREGLKPSAIAARLGAALRDTKRALQVVSRKVLA